MREAKRKRKRPGIAPGLTFIRFGDFYEFYEASVQLNRTA
jgi:hypothetical protein